MIYMHACQHELAKELKSKVEKFMIDKFNTNIECIKLPLLFLQNLLQNEEYQDIIIWYYNKINKIILSEVYDTRKNIIYYSKALLQYYILKQKIEVCLNKSIFDIQLTELQIGNLLKQLGQYQDAINQYDLIIQNIKDVDQIFYQIPKGKIELIIAKCKRKMGYCYFLLGNPQKSLIFQQESLNIYLNFSEQMDINRNKQIWIVSQSYSSIGNIELENQFFDIYTSQMSRQNFIKNKTYVSILGKIGVYYMNKGNFQKSYQYFEQQIDFFNNNINNEYNPKEAECYFNLGKLFIKIKEIQEILFNLPFTQQLNENSSFVMADDFTSFKCEDNTQKDFTYYKYEDFTKYKDQETFIIEQFNSLEKGLNYFKKSLQIRKQIYHSDHPIMAEVLQYIGICYVYKEEYQLAIQYLNSSFQIKQRSFQKNHYELLESLYYIGFYYYMKKDYQFKDHAIEMNEFITLKSEDSKKYIDKLEKIRKLQSYKNEVQCEIYEFKSSLDCMRPNENTQQIDLSEEYSWKSESSENDINDSQDIDNDDDEDSNQQEQDEDSYDSQQDSDFEKKKRIKIDKEFPNLKLLCSFNEKSNLQRQQINFYLNQLSEKIQIDLQTDGYKQNKLIDIEDYLIYSKKQMKYITNYILKEFQYNQIQMLEYQSDYVIFQASKNKTSVYLIVQNLNNQELANQQIELATKLNINPSYQSIKYFSNEPYKYICYVSLKQIQSLKYLLQADLSSYPQKKQVLEKYPSQIIKIIYLLNINQFCCQKIKLHYFLISNYEEVYFLLSFDTLSILSLNKSDYIFKVREDLILITLILGLINYENNQYLKCLYNQVVSESLIEQNFVLHNISQIYNEDNENKGYFIQYFGFNSVQSSRYQHYSSKKYTEHILKQLIQILNSENNEIQFILSQIINISNQSTQDIFINKTKYNFKDIKQTYQQNILQNEIELKFNIIKQRYNESNQVNYQDLNEFSFQLPELTYSDQNVKDDFFSKLNEDVLEFNANIKNNLKAIKNVCKEVYRKILWIQEVSESLKLSSNLSYLELNLNYCQFEVISILANSITMYPNLKTLQINFKIPLKFTESKPISPKEGLQYLHYILVKECNIKNITFDLCYSQEQLINNEHLEQICDAIQKLPKIEKLTFGHNHYFLDTKSLTVLTNKIQNCRSLKVISLGINDFYYDQLIVNDFIQNISKCDQLIGLALKFNQKDFNQQDFVNLGFEISKLKNKISLEIAILIEKDNLKYQKNQQKNIISSILKGLGENQILKNISILSEKCQIMAQDLSELGKEFILCSSLQNLILNLRECSINVECGKIIGKIISELKNLKSLKLDLYYNYIYLEGAYFICRGIYECKTIQNLLIIFARNNINQTSYNIICKELSKCNNLTNLIFPFLLTNDKEKLIKINQLKKINNLVSLQPE